MGFPSSRGSDSRCMSNEGLHGWASRYRWTCRRERCARLTRGCRAAARRFGVAPATVIRWYDQRRSTGSCVAKARGGDTRTGRIEAHAHTILALHAERRDITLEELRHALNQRGMSVALSTLHRFFARHGITRKKDRARYGAGLCRSPEPSGGLVRRAIGSRPWSLIGSGSGSSRRRGALVLGPDPIRVIQSDW